VADIDVQHAARDAEPLEWEEASAAGDKFVNTGREALLVRADVSGSATIRFTAFATVDGDLAVSNRTQNLGSNGEVQVFGPFPRHIYNGPDGKVNITYPIGHDDLFLAVVRIG
jgi:hypothetical protein